MGVPGADDVMLSHQSTSFHDALYLRGLLGLQPAPEFAAWLDRMGIGVGSPERIPESMTPALAVGMSAPMLWRDQRRFTPARVALGRVGNGLATAPHLEFQAAHAAARDAVHAALDIERLLTDLATLGRKRSVGSTLRFAGILGLPVVLEEGRQDVGSGVGI
jgi:hypothetical protein